MSSTPTSNHKPLILCLGTPLYVDKEYLEDFKSRYDFHLINPPNRTALISDIRTWTTTHGPPDAVMARFPPGPFGGLDSSVLSPLLSPSLDAATLPPRRCTLIASIFAGYDDYDIDWMTANRIQFCNTRNAVSEPTADMAMYLIMAVVRDTHAKAKLFRDAQGWQAGKRRATRDLGGLALGIVGMGSVGKDDIATMLYASTRMNKQPRQPQELTPAQHLARKALAFGLKIHYHNRTRLPTSEESQFSATYHSSLHSLLRTCDVVSLNCPLNPSTRHLLSTAEFAIMKPGSFLVNTARGGIVDEEALIEALESGNLERAGLDVYEGEPEVNGYFMASPRCVVQPHMGGNTERSLGMAERECLENIKGWFEGGVVGGRVNDIGGGSNVP